MTALLNITTPLPCETELFKRGFLKIFLLLFTALSFVNIEAFSNVETVVKVSYAHCTAKLFRLTALLKETARFQRFILENSV